MFGYSHIPAHFPSCCGLGWEIRSTMSGVCPFCLSRNTWNNVTLSFILFFSGTGVYFHRRLDHLFNFGHKQKTKSEPRAYHAENER